MARPSESKPEEPTPQRLAEARHRGSIAVSRDLLSGVSGFAVCVALVFLARSWVGGLVSYLRLALAQAPSSSNLAQAGRTAVQAGIDGLAIPIGVAAGVALAVGLIQTGGLFSTRPLHFDVSRLWPSPERRSEARSEALKALLQATVVAAVAWSALRPALAQVAHLAGASTASCLEVLGAVSEKLGLRLAVAALAWGAVDYLRRRQQHRKTLRMSWDEVRREHKEREGDPVLRAERQRQHREFLQNHRIDEVRRAKLVVVDSGPRAVALAYDASASGPPVVIAKGERLLAQKIVEMAREGGVLVAENAVLVQALGDVEEGNEIPETLYQPVAACLTQSEKAVQARWI